MRDRDYISRTALSSWRTKLRAISREHKISLEITPEFATLRVGCAANKRELLGDLILAAKWPCSLTRTANGWSLTFSLLAVAVEEQKLKTLTRIALMDSDYVGILMAHTDTVAFSGVGPRDPDVDALMKAAGYRKLLPLETFCKADHREVWTTKAPPYVVPPSLASDPGLAQAIAALTLAHFGLDASASTPTKLVEAVRNGLQSYIDAGEPL